MSQRKKTFGVILIVFVFIIIAVAGFSVVYLIKNAVTKPQVTTSIPKQTQPTPVPGFKTYQVKDKKISVDFPSELQLKESSFGLGVSTVELRSPDNTDPAYAPDVQMLVVPKTLALAIGQDFSTYYEMPDNTTKTIESPLDKEKAAENLTKIRNREINGHRALEYSSVPSPNPENQTPEIGVFIEAGDDMIIISTNGNNREQLEKMLSTFQYPQ